MNKNLNPENILEEIRKGKIVRVIYYEDAWNNPEIPEHIKQATEAAAYFGKNHPEVEITTLTSEYGGIVFSPRTKEKEDEKRYRDWYNRKYSDRSSRYHLLTLVEWGVINKNVSEEKREFLLEKYRLFKAISNRICVELVEKYYPKAQVNVGFTPTHKLSQYEQGLKNLNEKFVDEFYENANGFLKKCFIDASNGCAKVFFPFDKKSLEDIEEKQIKEVLTFTYKSFIE